MQKCEMHESHPSNVLFQSRYVPINISKFSILLDNVKTHAHLTKIDLLGFLEILMMNKTRKRRSHTCFYTGSLNHRATFSLPRQHEPNFTLLSKVLQNHIKITLLNKANTKIFESHKNLIPSTVRNSLTYLESYREHYRGTRTTKPDGGSP